MTTNPTGTRPDSSTASLTITATRNPTGTWRVEVMDRDTGAVVARSEIPADGRIGRGLGAIAHMLDL